MNKLELKMIDILKDLRENYHVIGVKAEFEAEGTRFEEALKLKEITTCAGLDFTIKIGGYEAIKDMYEAKIIGANTIVAPMIESPYAVKKYLQAVKIVFSQEERSSMKFLINIETKYGFQYIDEILNSELSDELSGIVLGRTDMAGSLGMSKDDVNHDIILDYANKLAQKVLKHKKEYIIGGGVSVESLLFFKNLLKGSLTGFETRKIIFDAQKALNNSNIENGILKALEFELMCLKHKKEIYGMMFKEDEIRLQLLETRFNKLKK